jgi:uncharacterized protein (TIGR03067 family)
LPVILRGSFVQSGKNDPAEIDWTDAGPLSVAKKGIDKLDGDKLITCVSANPNRPTTFEPAAGSELIVTVFKRIKKD